MPLEPADPRRAQLTGVLAEKPNVLKRMDLAKAATRQCSPRDIAPRCQSHRYAHSSECRDTSLICFALNTSGLSHQQWRYNHIRTMVKQIISGYCSQIAQSIPPEHLATAQQLLFYPDSMTSKQFMPIPVLLVTVWVICL